MAKCSRMISRWRPPIGVVVLDALGGLRTAKLTDKPPDLPVKLPGSLPACPSVGAACGAQKASSSKAAVQVLAQHIISNSV